MTKDEAMKLALEALEYASTGNRRPEIIGPAITSIKEALAQPEQEPVYFVWLRAHCAWMHTDKESFDKISDDDRWMLYSSPPPQRKPLTDEEIGLMYNTFLRNGGAIQRFARAIEAAHGIGEKK